MSHCLYVDRLQSWYWIFRVSHTCEDQLQFHWQGASGNNFTPFKDHGVELCLLWSRRNWGMKRLTREKQLQMRRLQSLLWPSAGLPRFLPFWDRLLPFLFWSHGQGMTATMHDCIAKHLIPFSSLCHLKLNHLLLTFDDLLVTLYRKTVQ